jgi:hypothetical protein
MANVNERFERLATENPGPVPNSLIHDCLFGLLDPVTRKPIPPEAAIYSEEQSELLLTLAEKEVAHVRSLPSPSQRLWITCMGGLGAGKTVALAQWVAHLFKIEVPKEYWLEPSLHKVMDLFKEKLPAPFVSPDRRGMLELALSILGKATSDKSFYDTWCVGSNAISNPALNATFAHGKIGVFDTTLTGAEALKLLDAALADNRYIAAVIVGSPRSEREKAVAYRNEGTDEHDGFYQSHPADFDGKEKKVGDRIIEVSAYMAKGGQLNICWRDQFNQDAWPAVATIFDNKYLKINDPAGFEKFCETYPQMKDLAARLELRPDYVDPLPKMMEGILAETSALAKTSEPAASANRTAHRSGTFRPLQQQLQHNHDQARIAGGRPNRPVHRIRARKPLERHR